MRTAVCTPVLSLADATFLAAPPPAVPARITEPAAAHPRDLADSYAEAVLDFLLPEGAAFAERVRDELHDALLSIDPADPQSAGWLERATAAVREVVERNRPELITLLDTLTINSLLAGMRAVIDGLPEGFQPPSERKGKKKPAPVGLESAAASPPAAPPAAFEDVEDIEGGEGDDEIYTADVATPGSTIPGHVPGTPSAAPPEEPPEPPPPDVAAAEVPAPGPAGRRLPLVDEAVRSLRDRRILTRADYDHLSAEAKRHAFTVAGHQAEAAIEKIRDSLASVVEEGPTLRDFEARVREKVGPGTFASPGHAETVYRNGVQGAYAQGMRGLLRHPLVGDVFPYVMRSAIRDDRVRPNHLALEKLGLNGTAVYRRDDPVYIKFAAPWAHG